MDELVSCYHLQWMLLHVFINLGNGLFNTLITKEQEHIHFPIIIIII